MGIFLVKNILGDNIDKVFDKIIPELESMGFKQIMVNIAEAPNFMVEMIKTLASLYRNGKLDYIFTIIRDIMVENHCHCPQDHLEDVIYILMGKSNLARMFIRIMIRWSKTNNSIQETTDVLVKNKIY